MIALINGVEGATLNLYKGGIQTINLKLISEVTGAPVDITADTFSLEIYDTEDRRNAALASVSGSIVSASAGTGTVSILVATIGTTFTAGGVYYGYVKATVDTFVDFSRKSSVINIK